MLTNILIIISILSIFLSKYLAIIPLGILLVLNIMNARNKDKDSKNSKESKEVYNGIFVNELKKIKEQNYQFKTKKKIIEDILSTEFGSSSITYRKFIGTVDNVEKVFLRNINLINNKIDKSDENKVLSNKNTETLNEMYKIFDENEKILKSLNDLIIELGKIDDLSNLKTLCSLEELELLIKDTKKYKTI